MQSLLNVIRHLGRLGAVLLAFHLLPAQGVLLGPETAMPAPSASQADLDRAKVRQFMEQANVAQKLRGLGVDGLQARDRVDALADDEVHALAQRIDGLPAGGRLAESDIIILLLVAILVLVAL